MWGSPDLLSGLLWDGTTNIGKVLWYAWRHIPFSSVKALNLLLQDEFTPLFKEAFQLINSPDLTKTKETFILLLYLLNSSCSANQSLYTYYEFVQQ